jgi:hypothetical protein
MISNNDQTKSVTMSKLVLATFVAVCCFQTAGISPLLTGHVESAMWRQSI